MEQNAAFQTIADHWTEIQDYVKNKKVTTELSYEMWIAPLKPHHLTLDEDGRATRRRWEKRTVPPNSGFQAFMSTHYTQVIETAIDQTHYRNSCTLCSTAEKNETPVSSQPHVSSVGLTPFSTVKLIRAIPLIPLSSVKTIILRMPLPLRSPKIPEASITLSLSTGVWDSEKRI